jgi:alcohol dehydrogenase class IV
VPPAQHDAFTFLDGERLVRFGARALEEAPALLSARGFDGYVLLTTERALDSAPILGEGAATILHVPSGPVPEAAAAVRDGVAGRPLVALGGGRVIDSAKAIAGADGLPSAAVPTTLSGAEMTPFHRMPAGVEQFKLVRPSLVIAVPQLMASQPMPDLAASAMNALAHAFEALYTPLANPVATEAACRGAAFISLALRLESPTLALGALLAGYASGSAGFAVHHAVCQTIVRVAGTPHAQTNAVMLPHFVRMMVPRAPVQIRLLGAATGVDTDGAERVPDHIAELSARAGVERLSELGVDRAVLDELVAAAVAHPALGNTPDPPGSEELRAVLEGAL